MHKLVKQYSQEEQLEGYRLKHYACQAKTPKNKPARRPTPDAPNPRYGASALTWGTVNITAALVTRWASSF